jgi:hypothetical protein
MGNTFDHCSLAGCAKPVDPLTAKWLQPVCVDHRRLLGYPTTEPVWQLVKDSLTRFPKMFSYRQTAEGPVKTV